jgi:antitoxin component YwqK of YwqJK toxin-antitoxin module
MEKEKQHKIKQERVATSPGGEKWKNGFFLEGKKQGNHSTFHSNGGMKTRGEFVMDVKVGIHYEFDEKGNVIDERYYVAGVEDEEAYQKTKLTYTK